MLKTVFLRVETFITCPKPLNRSVSSDPPSPNSV